MTLFKVCSVGDCEGRHLARGWCHRHYRRWVRHGDPTGGGRDRGSDRPTYDTMHARIRRLRGRASDHTCPCGAAARDWAYDHTDPDELQGPCGGFSMLYSTDPDRYVPLCPPCHKALDGAWAPPGALWFKAFLAVAP